MANCATLGSALYITGMQNGTEHHNAGPGLSVNMPITLEPHRVGEGISKPLSDILYNMLSDKLFKHSATQIESLVLSCR